MNALLQMLGVGGKYGKHMDNGFDTYTGILETNDLPDELRADLGTTNWTKNIKDFLRTAATAEALGRANSIGGTLGCLVCEFINPAKTVFHLVSMGQAVKDGDILGAMGYATSALPLIGAFKQLNTVGKATNKILTAKTNVGLVDDALTTSAKEYIKKTGSKASLDDLVAGKDAGFKNWNGKTKVTVKELKSKSGSLENVLDQGYKGPFVKDGVSKWFRGNSAGNLRNTLADDILDQGTGHNLWSQFKDAKIKFKGQELSIEQFVKRADKAKNPALYKQELSKRLSKELAGDSTLSRVFSNDIVSKGSSHQYWSKFKGANIKYEAFEEVSKDLTPSQLFDLKKKQQLNMRVAGEEAREALEDAGKDALKKADQATGGVAEKGGYLFGKYSQRWMKGSQLATVG